MSDTIPSVVVGYARLSTADQARGLTLEQQVSRLREAGADEVLVDLMSGTTTARPKYRELLKRVEQRTVSKVIATRWDRLSRSASETCRLVDVFAVDGAPELVLLDDPMDLTTIGGRMQLRLLGVIAQGEVERLRERSAAGKAHRSSKGLIDVAPFGMQVIAGMLQPDRRPFLSELTSQEQRTRADLLLEAYDAAAAGGSMHAPWRHLGDRYGVWIDRTGMRRLLLNPALRGARVGKRDKTTATWGDVEEGAGGEALIPPEDHQKFEAFIRGQMARRSVPDKRKKHLLAGKAVCGHCGSLMSRGSIVRSPNGRYFCKNMECGYAIAGKRRNSMVEPPLLEAILLAMAEQADAVAAAMEKQARRRDERASTAPEVQKLQAKRRTYQALLADGDPVQPVIDELDRQISALLAAGPSDGGGHLLQLRESALRRQQVIGSWPKGGGEMIPTDEVPVSGEEQAVATALRQSWTRAAGFCAKAGEEGAAPGPWSEVRELVRAAVIENKRLVRIELNL